MKISAGIAVAMVSAASATNLYAPGPFNVTQSTAVMEETSGRDPPLFTKGDLEIWQPQSEGDFPVLFYMGGFNAPVRTYSNVLERIASHGFVVAGIDGPRGPPYDEEAKLVQGSLAWMRTNLDAKLANGVTADLAERVVFGAHSAGNHALVQLLEETCDMAKGMIMMSPVDGADPFGIVDDFIIRPPAMTQFSTPTLHLAAGLDPLSTRPNFPACGPEELSNNRFYDHMNGQIFSIDALEWGHSDLVTPCVETGCPAYPGSVGDCPFSDDYLSFLGATSVAFMNGILGAGCSNFDFLTDESTMPIEVATKNTGVDVCPRASCTRV